MRRTSLVHAGTPSAWSDGLRLALTTFTVLPVRGPATISRPAAGWAMRFAPLVGALLGAALGAMMLGLGQLSAAPLLTGALTATAAAALTRGMHLDGLADTVDGLGSYRDADRALEIMKSPEIGPFGVVALTLTLLTQVSALAVLATRPWWTLLLAVIVAYATGRLAVALGCQRGVPAARPGGLGALVAGTVDGRTLAAVTASCALAAVWAGPEPAWQGPLAVLLSLTAALLLRRHAVRRLGGVTGDVLGCLAELGTTITLVGLALG
jgi:adenosylcobinamide-GDP ribazoletransferase